jgi:putative lipoprotein
MVMPIRGMFPEVELTGLILGLVLAGCTASDKEPKLARVDKQDDVKSVESVLTGSVSYRERMALPPDAVVETSITDMSPLSQAAPVIAEATIPTGGRQVPIPFELRYDSSKIVPDHTYAVKAAIRSGGKLLFETAEGFPVITQDNPTQANLWLQRATEGGGEGGRLLGTAWRLEDLGGAGVVDRTQATLEFAEDGKISGNGSCNRFFGTASISGDIIKISPLGSTRMACIEEAFGAQEAKYLKALGDAERFTRDGSALLIYFKGSAKPLRFAPMESTKPQ